MAPASESAIIYFLSVSGVWCLFQGLLGLACVHLYSLLKYGTLQERMTPLRLRLIKRAAIGTGVVSLIGEVYFRFLKVPS